MDSSRMLCVVIPCFDEAEVVEHTYAELKRVLCGLRDYRHLLYFVDDGSRDSTLLKLNALARRDESVRVLSLSRNFGHQIAIRAGLDHADRRADAILVMDADLENPPALIPCMIEQLELGHDVVLGVRETGRQVGLLARLGSRAFYWLFNKLSDVPITPGAPDFFLLSPRARGALEQLCDKRPFLRAMVAFIGFSAACVPYVPPARAYGRSKYTLSRMLGLAEDALFAFSSAPARGLLFLGLTLGAMGGALAVLSLYQALFATASITLWVCSGLSVLAGVNLVGLGIVASYALRAIEHSRERPLYFLRQAPDELRSSEPRLEVISQRKRA